MAGLGDVDGDGVPDYAVGIPGGADVGFADVPGQVAVYSGRTSTEIRRLSLGESLDAFGESLAGGEDVDGDGVGDLLVGAPGAGARGSVFLYSGASGALSFRWDGQAGDGLGSTLAFVGDLDGDGVRDIAATASQVVSVFVYSSRSGALIHQIRRPGDQGSFGASIADLGDVTGDGIGDIAIGSPPTDCSVPSAVSIVDGVTGQIVRQMLRSPGCGAFGESIALTRDVDADGMGDLAIASSTYYTGPDLVYIYSTRTDSLVEVAQLPDPAQGPGCRLAPVGDVEGNGGALVAVGVPRAPVGAFATGALALYSVETNNITVSAVGRSRYEELGYAVSAAGDVNGDGRQDVLVTAPGVGIGSQVFIPGGVAVYGFADLAPSRVTSATLGGAVNLASSLPLDVYIESQSGGYSPSNVVPETVRLRSMANVFRSIPSVATAPLPTADLDQDGTPEFLARFPKSELRALFFFQGQPAETMSVVIEGDLRDGRRLQAALFLRVETLQGPVARVIPNPASATGRLTFRTSRPGPVWLRMFDARGRLATDVYSGDFLGSGYHDVALGRAGASPMAAGVYFYRLETVDGTYKDRFVLLR